MQETRVIFRANYSQEEVLSTSSTLREFVESVSLVTGRVSGLFISKNLFSLGRKSVRIESAMTKLKK